MPRVEQRENGSTQDQRKTFGEVVGAILPVLTFQGGPGESTMAQVVLYTERAFPF